MNQTPKQPFFYPVANEACATHNARDWNTKDEASGYIGHVLLLAAVASEFLNRYPIRRGGPTRNTGSPPRKRDMQNQKRLLSKPAPVSRNRNGELSCGTFKAILLDHDRVPEYAEKTQSIHLKCRIRVLS